MNIMTKRGNLDNVITYEHYCDTVADLSNIPLSQTTLGSVAIVVNDEDDGMGIYIANSQKEWTPISTSIGGGSGEISLDLIHVCSNNEYDSITKVPTIEDAESNKIYLVPNSESGNNVFDEWIYADEAWERFGGGSINVPVTDVQVNGVSVVSDGVANVPVASSSAPGVVRVNSNYGFEMDGTAIRFKNASDAQLKAGTNQYRTISPSTQHQAAFYGLAKAAGDTTQSQSSNLVGAYTQSAKNAIHSMLGTQDFVEVGFVQNVSGTTPSITGEANYRYICGEVSTISITPPNAGTIDVLFESGSTVTVLTIPSTVKFPAWFDPNNLETNTIYELLIQDGVYGSVMTWAS